MKIRSVIFSWDFGLALLVFIIGLLWMPIQVSNSFAKDVYTIGISVLAILFSVYFAALAVIMALTTDEFVKFLEEEGQFTELVMMFRYSLLVLFFGLIYSILAYTLTSHWTAQQVQNQSRYFILFFGFFFAYGLFATLQSTFDAITYSNMRVKYLTKVGLIRKAQEGQ